MTDTVLATPLQALVVEIRTSGGVLARGTVVRFTAQLAADSTRRAYETPLYVCALSATSCGPSATNPPPYGGSNTVAIDTTDANGRAKVMVRFGTVAGPTYVVVSVPEFGLKESVPFTVTAGAPRFVVLGAHDVPVSVGGKATLAAAVTDLYRNARTDAVTYSIGAAPDVATLDAASATVTGVDVGSTHVFARAGSAVDSALVRVSPTGRLVVWDVSSRAIRMFNTDGTAPRALATAVASDYGAFPRFSPNGTVVVFQAAPPAGRAPDHLVAVDSTGANPRQIGLPAGVTSVAQPRLLAKGAVLFVGRQPLTGIA